jgi:hypothetical protein
MPARRTAAEDCEGPIRRPERGGVNGSL